MGEESYHQKSSKIEVVVWVLAGWMKMSWVSLQCYLETMGWSLVTAKEQPRLDGQSMETTSCSTHSPASGSERSLAVKQLSQALGWANGACGLSEVVWSTWIRARFSSNVEPSCFKSEQVIRWQEEPVGLVSLGFASIQCSVWACLLRLE